MRYCHGIDTDLGQAHESALKEAEAEAETDARKRALMTFVALPGQFSTTQSGAGMPQSVQVISRPCLRSRFLACSGAFLP